MATTALVLAVLAFVFALSARSTAAAQAQSVEDARRDARRLVENLNEELAFELKKQREMIAQLAGGEQLSAQMVREGRLWRDVLPTEAAELFEKGELRILDVRTPQETASGILPGALHIPIDQLEERLAEVPSDKAHTLVYCAMGGRSAAACELLSQEGRNGLLNLQGGIGSWTGPIEKTS